MTDNSRVRVSIVGVVIVALFIALLARLWFLQMGAEEELRFQAVARSTRDGADRVAAWADPRPQRNGARRERRGVVGHGRPRSSTRRPTSASSASSPKLLAPQYTAEQLEQNFNDLRQTPLKPAIVAVGDARKRRVSRSSNTSRTIPAPSVQKLTVRHYPQRPARRRTSSDTSARSPTNNSDAPRRRLPRGRDDRQGRRRARVREGPARRAADARRSKSTPPANPSARRSTSTPGIDRQRRRTDDRRELASRGRARARSRASSPHASSRTRTSRTSASRT